MQICGPVRGLSYTALGHSESGGFFMYLVNNGNWTESSLPGSIWSHKYQFRLQLQDTTLTGPFFTEVVQKSNFRLLSFKKRGTFIDWFSIPKVANLWSFNNIRFELAGILASLLKLVWSISVEGFVVVVIVLVLFCYDETLGYSAEVWN